MLKQFENHPDFFWILQKTKLEFREQGAFFLEEGYLRELHSRLQVFPRTIDDICADAAAIRNCPEKALYALFVVRAMEQRQLFLDHLPLFTFPEEAHPFFALLCLIPAIPKLYGFLTEREVPEDVIAATLGQFEACVFIYSLRYDRLGLNKRYFDWLQHYVDCEILNIQRLRFEVMKLEDPIYLLRRRATGETVLLMDGVQMNAQGLYADTPPVEEAAFRCRFAQDEHCYTGNPVSAQGRCLAGEQTFPKAEYELLLQPGDLCLSVHIPDQGDFSHASCLDSYARAKAVFERHFPELKIKAFHCHSWMMAPELASMLKSGSRILSFSGDYLRYPIPTQGEDVLNFVFLLKFKTYEDLAEDTSLQRALKKLYVNGQYLYEYGGVFPL